MRGIIRFAWLPLLATSIFAAPINISTATGAWQVSQTSQLGGATLNSGALGVVTSAVQLTGTLPGDWQQPSGGWIGQLATDGNEFSGLCDTDGVNQSCGGEAGTYTYTLSFSTALGGQILGFQYTADNQINSISIVNTTTSTTIYSTGQSAGDLHQQLVSAPGTLNFGAGTIVITVVVQNDPLGGAFATWRNPTGFLALGSANSTEVEGVPEPSTYAMLGLGGAALLVARLRRRK
jgi:hypothetical protein